MSIMFTFLSTLVVWAFWIPLHEGTGGIITFAVLYGIFTGAVIALKPALISQIWYVFSTPKPKPLANTFSLQ